VQHTHRLRRRLSLKIDSAWSFPCTVVVCVSFDSLLSAYINLVFGFCPECVTDALFK
jgi:hypothetical protein